MVEERFVKSDFMKFVDASIVVSYGEEKCEYSIETGMNFTVFVTEDVENNQYNVLLKHASGKEYELSSYEVFKEYIKKHTKKLFGKKDMAMHMKAISEFVNLYKDLFFEVDTMDVFVQGKVRGTKDIFIA